MSTATDTPASDSQGASASRPDSIRGMFARIAGRYDFANHALSGGLDFLWRRKAVGIVRGWQPKAILDVATGSGDLALALAAGCPGAVVTGTDFCLPMLEVARRKGVQRLVAGDGMCLPFREGSFDALTVAFGLRNMADYPGAVREMARVVRPGGHVLILDFSLPQNALIRAGYRFYLHRILPGIAGIFTGEPGAYRYLCGSIEAFPRGDDMCALLRDAGLRNSRSIPLSAGIVSIYHGEVP